MNNELIKEINEIAESRLNDKRFNAVNNFEDMWNMLKKLYLEWEDEIDSEHKNNFVTDDVENQFKGFAKICTQYVVNSMETLNIPRNELVQFFEHRHNGYGFYSSYEEMKDKDKEDRKLKESLNKILEDHEYKKITYCSLAKYFLRFHGKFHDNEMAIYMLCKYYSDNLGLEDKMQDLLVSALYTHITNAGTPGDSGYAYGGISRIREGIGKFPKIIIEKLLKRYETYRVINEKNYRRQVYTIIKNSDITDIERNQYKFFFIDSIWLAQVLGRIAFNKYKSENEEIMYLSWNYKSCAEVELPVFEKQDSIYKCFWTYENYDCRFLKLENETIAQIYLNGSIYIKSNKDPEKIDFDLDDWVLNEYDTRNFDNKLEGMFKSSNTDIYHSDGSKFLFSYIYLDGHRRIKEQQLSFDHKYYFDKESNSINLNDISSFEYDNFYGRNIYSLSAVVGRNGTGKTSVLEFLSKFFFGLINLIEGKALAFDGNIIKLKEDLVFNNSVLKKETIFLVIFKFNNKYYFLTNKENVQFNKSQVLPYRYGLLTKKNDNSKIIYFQT